MSHNNEFLKFTSKELAILYFLTKGMTNKEIAGVLKISVGTLRTHLKNIYRKLNLDNRNALVIWCTENKAQIEEEIRFISSKKEILK